MMEREGVTDRIESLRAAFERHTIERRNANYPKLAGFALWVEVEFGKRYARLIRAETCSRSACGFVDLTNGDALFPAGWKGPAKHARGNVFAEDFGLSAFGDFGVKALR